MIPERELGGARPPLSLEYAFVLALLAPLIHVVCAILLTLIGFRGQLAVVGMAAVLTYAGIFALCAARFRRPPAKELALARAPAQAWLAVPLLLGVVVLSSEVDNVLRALLPAPPQVATPPENLPPYFVPTLLIVVIVVQPLAYELFFRGVLQPLAVARLGIVAGIVLAASLAAVAQGVSLGGLGLRSLVPGLLNATTLCVLRQSSGSLLPPIALHMGMGVVLIGAEFQLFGLAGFDDVAIAHTPVQWLAGATLATLAGFFLCRSAARARA